MACTTGRKFYLLLEPYKLLMATEDMDFFMAELLLTLYQTTVIPDYYILHIYPNNRRVGVFETWWLHSHNRSNMTTYRRPKQRQCHWTLQCE